MRRLNLRLLPLIILLLALVIPAHAALRNNLTFRISCEGFISRGGDIILNRDNTGTGREQFVISATDANGRSLYSVTESSFVGATIFLPAGLMFEWQQVPEANPITVRVTSSAGNGLNEQLVYVVSGSCDDLPTVSADFAELEMLDGTTSPSVALNAPPPRPDGSALSLETSPGYLIVNTGSLNIRSGDGAEYTIVGRVDGGTNLRVLGRNTDRSWWYVAVDDIIGWVSGELVLIRGDLSDAPVVPVMGEITRPSFFTYSTTSLLTIPVPGALAICEIGGNQEYYVIGRDIGTDWYEVEATCNGTAVTGWVAATQGAIRNPAESFIPVTD